MEVRRPTLGLDILVGAHDLSAGMSASRVASVISVRLGVVWGGSGMAMWSDTRSGGFGWRARAILGGSAPSGRNDNDGRWAARVPAWGWTRGGCTRPVAEEGGGEGAGGSDLVGGKTRSRGIHNLCSGSSSWQLGILAQVRGSPGAGEISVLQSFFFSTLAHDYRGFLGRQITVSRCSTRHDACLCIR